MPLSSSSSSSRSSFRPASGGSWAGYHPPGYAARETLKTAKRAVLPHVVPPEFDSATQAARERNKKWSLHSSVCLGLEEETGAIVSVGTRQHRHPRGTQTSGAGVATDNETARADHTADAAAASARARAAVVKARASEGQTTATSRALNSGGGLLEDAPSVPWHATAKDGLEVNRNGAPGRIVDGANPLAFHVGERLRDIPQSVRFG